MKLNVFIATIFSVLLSVSNILATPQQPDILIHEGKEYRIYGQPLERFFAKNPERRPKFCSSVSSLWRGYVAVIEVVKTELLLKDVKIHTVNPYDPNCLQESKIAEVVPDGKSFKLDWLSGELLSAHGEHIGGDNFYDVWKVWSRYTVFKIDKGNLKELRHFTNKQYQDYLAENSKN